jgi:tetratricopeptide (TPR) repeat protein
MAFRTFIFLLSLFTAASAADKAALNALGIKAYERGDYDEAAAAFLDALKLVPGDQTIAKNLANACRASAGRLAKGGDGEAAIKILRQAMSYLPGEASIKVDLAAVLINQAGALLEKKDYDRARSAAEDALRLDEGNPAANCLAGDIAYSLQDLDGARRYWQAAAKANPGSAMIAGRLQRLKKEQGAERGFSKMEAYHFDIRFDYQALGGELYDVRKFLIEAYEKVGQDFDLFPSYPIVVILYKESDFRMVSNMPGYVAGLYDGKIRVPINFTRYPLATLKGVLFHEYTHAVIWDIAGPSCPIWLNEGMAMREMNGQFPVSAEPLRRALSKNATLSLDELCDVAGTWRNPVRIDLAYAQAWIMVEYLYSRWSGSDIKALLQGIKQGASFPALLQKSMNRTPKEFEEEWIAYAKGRAF